MTVFKYTWFMAYLHCGFSLLGYSYASCSCCQGFLSAFYPADFDLLTQGYTASGTLFSFYLMWWKLLEMVNLLLVFQWGNKSSRCVRTFIPVADLSILVPEEHLRRQCLLEGAQEVKLHLTNCTEDTFQGEILPTVLRQLPAHVKALGEQ